MDNKVSAGIIVVFVMVVVLAGVLVFNPLNTNNNNPINQSKNNNTNDTSNTMQSNLPLMLQGSQPTLSPTPSPTPGPSPGPTPTSMDNIISKFDQYFQSTFLQSGIPAAAVVIVQNGKIIYINCLGVKDLSTKEPVDENTLFYIGSATKQFTATNIAQLVSKGVLSWDDPVSKYYPNSNEFQLYDDYVTKQITIRDCLCHRSGLPTASGDHLFGYFNYSYPYTLHQLRYIKNSTAFRSTWQYYNILYALAGYCAAKKTNTPWSKLMKEMLLEPLGMKTATLTENDFKNSPNHATPYKLLSNGTYEAYDGFLDPIGPAGSMACSIKEMANWLKFQIANTGMYNGVRIMSKKELDETHTGQIKVTPSYTMYGSEYCLGWFIDGDSINHPGDSLAFASKVRIYQYQGLGIAIFANGGAYANSLRHCLDFKFKDLLNGKYNTDPWPDWKKKGEKKLQPVLDPPAPPLIPQQATSTYTGVYHSTFSGNIKINANKNTLICYYGNNKRPFALKHWNGDVFTDPTTDASLNFTDIHHGTAHKLIVPFTSDYKTTLSDPDVFKRISSQ